MPHTPNHKEAFEKIIKTIEDKKQQALEALAGKNPFAAIATKINKPETPKEETN